ncbi:MAG: hypothetical protein IKF93_06075 [Lachnospiraceae bacterium]|nr:hypothetical protein [Lachnospiraceae bacterium]
MMDKNIRLFQAITDIDDAIIEEAQRNKTSQKNSKVFYTAVIAAAAAACVILVGVLLYSGAIGGGRGGSMAGGGEIPAGGGADIEERDYSPIAYKDLALPTANGIPGGADMTYGSGGASADITTFNESNLQEISCCGILEGKILQIYPKEYAVDFYDDKFGEVQLFHGKAYSIVYEMEIEKVWYGDDFAAGQTFLVEDEYFQLDPLASLVEGRTYVIPIYVAGDQIGEAIYSVHELAPGDFTRDSIYSTVYPYHPQITKTEDGNYLVTSDWQTLTADPCREVIADEDDFEPYYQDKLRLVYGDDFAERLHLLVQEQLGEK